MAAWSRDELRRIGTAEGLEIASLRRDGALRDPVTVWVVRLNDDLYVRSVNGSDSTWFRGAHARHEACIRAGGVEREVRLVETDRLGDDIDAVYRTKYRRYAASIIDSIVSPKARAATMKLVPGRPTPSSPSASTEGDNRHRRTRTWCDDLSQRLIERSKTGDDMQIIENSIATAAGPATWFTGAVYLDEVATPTGPSRMQASSVHFTPGARTAWHSHPNGQTIYVTDGVGRVQARGEQVEVIRTGDRVFFEAGEDHWHGAAPDRFMTYLSMVQVDDEGNSATWGRHVSDEEYSAGRNA
jgi:quercetin dioxygenase-like cupin family protein